MKYIIDEETHWQNDTAVLYPRDVAEQLHDCGVFELAADEKIGGAKLDEDGWLVVEILYNTPEDPRADACLTRNEMFSMSEIRDYFTAADYYQWATDEDGDDVLLCFGC